MRPESIEQHGSEVRALLARGAFRQLQATLRNGSTLPAEPFARAMLDDLDYLTRRARAGGHVDDLQWQQLDDDLRLLGDLAGS
jgi:hypothetical protein